MSDHAASRILSTVVAQPRAAASKVFARAFRDWAGVPRGPLGWISAHTVLNTSDYPAVADALHLCPDDELLELGCGSAGFLAGQADLVHRVAGIDLSGIQVGLARKRLAERIAAGTAEIVHGDAAALPWPDASFTVVTCMSVFEAFPDPSGVVAEVFRVLRPGGRAVLNIGERVDPGTADPPHSERLRVGVGRRRRAAHGRTGRLLRRDAPVRPVGRGQPGRAVVRQGGWPVRRRPALGPRYQAVAQVPLGLGRNGCIGTSRRGRASGRGITTHKGAARDRVCSEQRNADLRRRGCLRRGVGTASARGDGRCASAAPGSGWPQVSGRMALAAPRWARHAAK